MNELLINGLRGGVAGKEIIRDISLRIRTGETHIIMGPNGGGKSTLSYLLAGHPEYTSTGGSAMLNSKDLLSMSADKRGKQGLFLGFQHPPEISGIDLAQVLHMATNHNANNEGINGQHASLMGRIDTLAQDLGLPEETSSRSLNQGFSGGEKKRAEILQMAILQPKIAILDEPDSGLDVDGLRQIADAINKMKHATGFIIITHHQHIVHHLDPDYVHILVHGKIVESGDKTLAAKIEREGYGAYAR